MSINRSKEGGRQGWQREAAARTHTRICVHSMAGMPRTQTRERFMGTGLCRCWDHWIFQTGVKRPELQFRKGSLARQCH